MTVENILKTNGIQFITQGKNVKPGNVNIHCPWCGSNDPSYHLGINLINGYYGCWRDPRHRGKQLHFVLSRVLGISFGEAARLTGQTNQTPDGFANIQSRLTEQNITPTKHPLTLPDNFLPIIKKGCRLRFWKYLQRRSYTNQEITIMLRRYQLKCCLTRDFKYRIIIPIFFKHQLVGWTGRSILNTNLRYLSHPSGQGFKDYLFDYNRLLKGGRLLIITEGPFDAINVKIRSGLKLQTTCLFGKIASQNQIALLLKLEPLFNRFVILLDSDALSAALHLKSQLAGCKTSIISLPKHVKDPGDLNTQELEDLVYQLK